MKNILSKNIVAVVAIFILLALLFGLIPLADKPAEEISMSRLAEMLENESIEKIIVVGNTLEITDTEGATFTTLKETESSLSESLTNYGVSPEKIRSTDIDIKEPQDWSWLGYFVIAFLPLIILIFFFWYMLKQAKGGAGGIQSMEFTKAKARLFGAEERKKEKTTLSDVAGLREVKEELQR